MHCKASAQWHSHNRTIGRFHLDGIPPAPRGVPQVEVTFDIDANGIINVSAKDKATNKEQSIRIEASSGLTDEEIERMKNEAEANADTDREAREKADTVNQADSLIFQTEKQLSEYGEKIPAEKKQPIDDALAALKDAHKTGEVDAIKPAMEALNTAFQAASQDMYNAANADGAEGAPADAGNPEAANEGDEEVTDVDFEEVGDDK